MPPGQAGGRPPPRARVLKHAHNLRCGGVARGNPTHSVCISQLVWNHWQSSHLCNMLINYHHHQGLCKVSAHCDTQKETGTGGVLPPCTLQAPSFASQEAGSAAKARGRTHRPPPTRPHARQARSPRLQARNRRREPQTSATSGSLGRRTANREPRGSVFSGETNGFRKSPRTHAGVAASLGAASPQEGSG